MWSFFLCTRQSSIQEFLGGGGGLSIPGPVQLSAHAYSSLMRVLPIQVGVIKKHKKWPWGGAADTRVTYSSTLFLLFHNVIIDHDKRNESIKWRIRHVVIPEI